MLEKCEESTGRTITRVLVPALWNNANIQIEADLSSLCWALRNCSVRCGYQTSKQRTKKSSEMKHITTNYAKKINVARRSILRRRASFMSRYYEINYKRLLEELEVLVDKQIESEKRLNIHLHMHENIMMSLRLAANSARSVTQEEFAIWARKRNGVARAMLHVFIVNIQKKLQSLADKRIKLEMQLKVFKRYRAVLRKH